MQNAYLTTPIRRIFVLLSNSLFKHLDQGPQRQRV